MRILLRIPHPREPVANSLRVARDDSGRLEVESEIWYQRREDETADPDPESERSEPIRELVRRIVGGDVLYRVMLDLLWQDRLSDPEVEQTVEVLSALAPEMVADFRAAHRNRVVGREIGTDPFHAPRVPEPVTPNLRLTYRFVEPTTPAMEHALQGLDVLDGELLEVTHTKGDTVVELLAQVRAESWAANPEVWGGDPSGRTERVYFGRVQEYLAGDPRFRILVIPAMHVENDRDRLVTFLRFTDTGGYLVGGRRQGD